MMHRLQRALFTAVLLVSAVGNANGQATPSEISSNMLMKSMEEVLGSYQDPEWKAIGLGGLDEETLQLKQTKTLPDSLYVGRVSTGDGVRWIIPDIAPSKSELFSFILYLDENKKILDVDVLTYRESYGYEIDYPFFRAQFKGMSQPDDIRFGRSVQNISGATISARSITYAVHDLLSILNHVDITI